MNAPIKINDKDSLRTFKALMSFIVVVIGLLLSILVNLDIVLTQNYSNAIMITLLIVIGIVAVNDKIGEKLCEMLTGKKAEVYLTDTEMMAKKALRWTKYIGFAIVLIFFFITYPTGLFTFHLYHSIWYGLIFNFMFVYYLVNIAVKIFFSIKDLKHNEARKNEQ